MKMKRFFIVIGLVITGISVFCQTDSEKQEAYNIAKQAIELMDNGEYDKSIKLLEESAKIDPTNYLYPYEIGYALILKEKYKKAAEYFENVIKMEGINDQCYQMLGNAYSLGGDKEKAIEAYNRGLEVYPNSGRLYLEIGNVHQDDWNKALEYYEQGVRVDPTFSSNYYWLTKIFCNSTEEMWGMLYGEMFMNIERGSKRTEEISQLLFDTYKSEIKFTSDTSMTVSFCQNHTIYADNKKTELPFSLIYEPGLIFAISISDSITIQSLNKIRLEFINFYFDKKFNKSHPNIVFDWHKKLIKDEKFECYNYWLLMQGAPDEFNAWYEKNKERFDNFLNWFSENPMLIDDKNNFHRFDY
jgi:tetratricopeptide (TPR) repeat protein